MNQDRPFRLLHLPNEEVLDNKKKQIGARKAFQKMLDDGELSGLHTYSFLYESSQLEGGYEAACVKILEEAREFKPDVIFWQHIDIFKISQDFLLELKNISSKPKLIYHEADPYGRYFKTFSEPMKVMVKEADMVFLVGLGIFAQLMMEHGAKRVYYAPHNFDNIRSGTPWEPTLKREEDLVMIANLGNTRVPGRYFPGGKRRKLLAKKLSERFGRRFALFGRGWDDLEASRGMLPFDMQEETIRSARISINWDHFDTVPYYFSNRLPISLAAGVPHITCYHPGYEHVFKDCPGGLYAVKTIDEAVETAQYLLSLPDEYLIEEGRKGREFVFEHLEANTVYRNIMRKVQQVMFA